MGAPSGNKDRPKRRQQDALYDAGRTTAKGGLSSPLAREAACVFAWAIASLVVDSSLSSLASFSPGAASLFLPSKVASGRVPGLSYGSAWVILPLRDAFGGGALPSLPCRVAEVASGRTSASELAGLLPAHLLAPALAFRMARAVAPSSVDGAAARAGCGAYSEGGMWFADVLREVFANAFLVVGLLVVPELLRINGVRRGFALLVLYPVYSFGVDADGKVRSNEVAWSARDVQPMYMMASNTVPYGIHSNHHAQFRTALSPSRGASLGRM